MFCVQISIFSTNMRIQEFSCAFMFLLFLSIQLYGIHLSFVSCQCVRNQMDLLLELRNNLTYDASLSTKLVQWNQSSDCCQWDGVQCDFKGRVTGLDLSSESISGGISGIFMFESLQSLNLAQNSFESAFPQGFGMLTNLSSLNMSDSGFSGLIPEDFLNLTRLVVLDLSSTYFSHYLEIPDLRLLIRNFDGLTELHLNGVNISDNNYDWCNAISSYLLDLRVLSLANAYITGPFHDSLSKLQSLEVIRLDGNNLSSPFPEFFADFPNLRVLTMSSCYLSGVVPGKLFQIRSLQTIDLSDNHFLEGSLPEFPLNSSFQSILVSDTNFSGSVPETISRLFMLTRLNLRNCKFSGVIPSSFTNLTQLEYLDLSTNHFTGPVPSFNSLRNLATIDLSVNRLTGQIHDSLWEGIQKLESLDLSENSLEGEIPPSLFLLPSLKVLRLNNNHFNGSIRDSGNSSALSLETIELDGNSLEGTIPQYFFNLYNLTTLSLAMNKLNGSFDLTEFPTLINLVHLDLSHNNLSVHMSGNTSVASLFPRLNNLRLVHCNLLVVPNLSNQSSLMMLDLSQNNISGEIPNWLWEVGNGFLRFVNLSHNQLTSLQEPYDLRHLHFLDLHSNMLGGQIPLQLTSAGFVDFSSNNFSSHLPPEIGNFLTQAMFFSIANNNISGPIPTSLCNTSSLQVLDFSNNGFHGRIPSCLVGVTLRVFNLRSNNITGNIPEMFPLSCRLETLDLSLNSLQGQVPVSLSRCSEIEVLNLGNNNLTDAFPCLRNLSQLHVLALRSNAFYGNLSCLTDNMSSNLQIIDIASNNFDGVLLSSFFSNLKAMTENGAQRQLGHLSYASLVTHHVYYQDSVTVNWGSQDRQLQKILSISTVVDFSNNHFQGVIPETIGELNALYVLDLSHNALSGQIPPSVGNMRGLGLLDLSFNNLGGEIPQQLASLTFLSFFNLSHNQLVGRIPLGNQMHSFPETSFIGNRGLCGIQVNRNCSDNRAPSLPQAESDSELISSDSEIYVTVAVGFLVGIGIIFVPLLFSRRWSKCYTAHLNKFILLILRQNDHQRENDDWW